MRYGHVFRWALVLFFGAACSDDLVGEGDGGDGTDSATDPDTGDTDSAPDDDTESSPPQDSDTTDPGDGLDGDQDGWYPPFDCNDLDGNVNPDAPEVQGDEVDNDCDGATDEEETDTGGGPQVTQYSELWYSSDNLLVYVPIDPDDGTVVDMVASEISDLPRGQNCLTMLANGSLLGARLAKADMTTYFYYIPSPPRDGSPVTPVLLGTMPDGIMLEGLYTDCDGRIYGMDTGADDGSATGNRLLRFTGNVLASDFTYVVVSDLSTASVADIDDMGPGIDADGNVTDNPGIAIDTGNLYDFNYETGSGTLMGTGGTWGTHVLGGPLFTDGVSRLYLLSSAAQVFEMDPQTGDLSAALGTGPAVATAGDNPGWSGLAGPLTDCETGFTLD